MPSYNFKDYNESVTLFTPDGNPTSYNYCVVTNIAENYISFYHYETEKKKAYYARTNLKFFIQPNENAEP